jgi:hypothetical protein
MQPDGQRYLFFCLTRNDTALCGYCWRLPCFNYELRNQTRAYRAWARVPVEPEHTRLCVRRRACAAGSRLADAAAATPAPAQARPPPPNSESKSAGSGPHWQSPVSSSGSKTGRRRWQGIPRGVLLAAARRPPARATQGQRAPGALTKPVFRVCESSAGPACRSETRSAGICRRAPAGGLRGVD